RTPRRPRPTRPATPGRRTRSASTRGQTPGAHASLAAGTRGQTPGAHVSLGCNHAARALGDPHGRRHGSGASAALAVAADAALVGARADGRAPARARPARRF